MKKLILFSLLVFCAVTIGFSQEFPVYLDAAIEYNPVRPEYITGSIGVNMALLSFGSNKIFMDMRLGGGVMTLSWEEKNQYSKEQEIVTRKKSDGLLTMTFGFTWQYEIENGIGLRIGFYTPIYVSNVLRPAPTFSFSSVSSSNPFGIGLCGRVGVSLFPDNWYTVVIEANPGIMIGSSFFDYFDDMPFCIPITLIFGFKVGSF